MSLSIGMPGLDLFIDEVPDGSVLLVEGGLDPSVSVFAQHVARRSLAAGRDVRYVTSRDAEQVALALDVPGAAAPAHVEEAVTWSDPTVDGDLFVDAFSFLAAGLSPRALAQVLQDLRRRCRETGAVALLTAERGMLSEPAAAVACHLADGILQFHAREETDGLVRYLRVPKWVDGGALAQNLYYGLHGPRILIDTRKRVA